MGVGLRVLNTPSEGKIHDLWAKALVLQDTDGPQGSVRDSGSGRIDRMTSQAACERLAQDVVVSQRSEIVLSTSRPPLSGPVVGRI